MCLLQERECLWPYAMERLETFAAERGCTVLKTPDNPISIAIALDSLDIVRGQDALDAKSGGGLGAELGKSQSRQGQPRTGSAEGLPISFLGSMLFSRLVSGTRVVARGKRQAVEGLSFEGYGAHCDAYPHDYLTMAVALGTTRKDVDEFIVRLSSCMQGFKRRNNKRDP